MSRLGSAVFVNCRFNQFVMILRSKVCSLMMKKGTDKTDVFPGILRRDGDKLECKCTVAIITKLTPGSVANAVSTSLRIESVEQSQADGNYRLDVRGRIFKVRREGGKWPILKL